MSDVQLEVIDLRKSYGDVHAVDGVSFQVHAGEITCLAGPNGSGKTTTVEMIEGLRSCDSGRVVVLGQEMKFHDRRPADLGVQLQEESLPTRIKVSEAIGFYTRVYRPKRSPESLVQALGLREFWNSPFVNLSGGQKRRTMLALAMLVEPRALILDEPTSGLDPEAQETVVQLLQDLRAEGVAILTTMHDLVQAETLADDVVLLHRGKVVQHGTPRELIDDLGATHRLSLPADVAIGDQEWTELDIHTALTIGRRRLLYGGAELPGRVQTWQGRQGTPGLGNFELRSVGLVDVYLHQLNESDVSVAAADLKEAV